MGKTKRGKRWENKKRGKRWGNKNRGKRWGGGLVNKKRRKRWREIGETGIGERVEEIRGTRKGGRWRGIGETRIGERGGKEGLGKQEQRKEVGEQE